MSRSFVDGSLREWGVHASAGKGGFPRPSRIVFVCLSGGERETRIVDVEESRAEAEARLLRANVAELRELLAAARPPS